MLTLIALARPGLGQNADLKPLLAGAANIPLTLKLGDLNGDWRCISVGLQAQSGRPMSIVIPDGAVPDFNQDNVYYTKGDIVAVGADEFLVAYHEQVTKVRIHWLGPDGMQSPPPVPLTADTVLTLSLLNLHTVVSLSDIHPFNLGEEATTVALAASAAARQQSLDNLRQLGRAILQYTQDNDEMMPPMQDATAAKEALFPYVQSDFVFIDSQTRRAFLPNTSLSHRSIDSISIPAGMVTYYEDKPAADSTRAVLFLDGMVKCVTQAEWSRYKLASHVPNPPAPTALPPGGQ